MIIMVELYQRELMMVAGIRLHVLLMALCNIILLDIGKNLLIIVLRKCEIKFNQNHSLVPCMFFILYLPEDFSILKNRILLIEYRSLFL